MSTVVKSNGQYSNRKIRILSVIYLFILAGVTNCVTAIVLVCEFYELLFNKSDTSAKWKTFCFLYENVKPQVQTDPL